MKTHTHPLINPRLCGEPISLEEGVASVALTATQEMAVDAHGLVHGGFVYGLADHAAMLAVNDPHVVLGSSTSRFLAPVGVGERVVATATRERVEGRRHHVLVSAVVEGRQVFEGTFVAFVLDRHVMDR